MNQQSPQLSLIQFTLLIYKTQIGFVILILPRTLSRAVDTDGWILALLGCVITILTGCLIVYIMRQHPNETLYDLLPKYLGKWIAKLFVVIWIIYALLIATIGLFTATHLINVWILPNTPVYLLTILFIIPIYMVTSKGIYMLGRFAELVFFVGVLMPILLLFSLKDVEWLNLVPVLKRGWEPILKNIQIVLPAFYGFELVFFWYPFLEKKKKAIKGIVIANLLTLYILLMVVLICSVKFNYKEIIDLLWPSVELLKLIRFPFLERFEGLFLSFYLYLIFSTIIPYLYVACLGIRKMIGKPKKGPGKIYLLLIFACWLLVSWMYTLSYTDLVFVSHIMDQYSAWIVFYFTFALVAISFVRNWWKRVKAG